MATYTATHSKSASFYESYDRKSELVGQTHYCPGCGHGVAHKLVAEAVDRMGLKDRAIFVSPVGCSVFAYYYFDFGNVQAAHGRAAAVATGLKRTRPDSLVISYQGDGDLAAIGTAEIVHAANRGESISVFFVNNAIYGMTGGQMAPTTLIGQVTSTTPLGRSARSEGYPLRMCELLATLEAPAYIERVALGDGKQIMKAARAIRRALSIQEKGLGFSFVEILSPCPTVWKKSPVDAKRWVQEEMTKVFPLGVFRDRAADSPPADEISRRAAPVTEVPRLLGLAEEDRPEPPLAEVAPRDLDLQIRIAGFGGQGVLLLGQLLAEAGLDGGFEVSWLPSYGPEMRSGTSNCHVRIAKAPIDTPLVGEPNVLFALNEPSLRKFIGSAAPGCRVFYNGAEVPADCRREDVKMVAMPFAEMANALGEARAANMLMLGAMLGATGALGEDLVHGALSRLVASERWREIDRLALRSGRAAFQEGPGHESP